ncbi:MAG: VWA domain-containing protein [Terriglobales bacterium]
MHRLETFAIFLLCAAAVASQGPAQPSNTASPVVSTLLISARAKDGSVELTTADLEIKEDGKPVQVQQVRKLGTWPLHYCVLFDSSNSERDRFDVQQDVAVRFLQQVARPGTDHGWLGLFSDEYVESNETDNPVNIIDNIRRIKPAGGTALYDAIAMCARRMAGSSSGPPLRVMFLFSDGGDNSSRISLVGVIDAASRAGTRIYAFDTDNGHNSKGESVLKKMTEATGGRLFTPARAKDADKLAAEVNSDLQNVFEVTYVPEVSRPDGRSASIDVKCVRQGTTVLAPKRLY